MVYNAIGVVVTLVRHCPDVSIDTLANALTDVEQNTRCNGGQKNYPDQGHDQPRLEYAGQQAHLGDCHSGAADDQCANAGLGAIEEDISF